MKKETDKKINFKQYCHSKEESNAPLITNLVKLGKTLEEIPWIKNDSICMASRYGKRLLTTVKDFDIKKMKRQDFIEIIDVDPVKQTILYFGPSIPSDTVPYLWMIHYAKKELQFSLYIEYKQKLNIIESFPCIGQKGNFLDIVKNILYFLQQSSGFQFNTNGIIITGKTIDEIEKILHKGEMKIC